MREIVGIAEIRDGAVVAAGRAKVFGVIGDEKPVADVVLRVGAKTVSTLRHRQRGPQPVGLLQCRDNLALGHIAQSQPATCAGGVLEIERLPAVLALEELHGPLKTLPARTGW